MNKKLATAFLATGLMLGGVGAASAYDGSATTPDAENTAEVSEQTNGGQIITVQDPDGAEEAPEAAQDREGRGHHGRRGCGLNAAAEAIGIEAGELRAALDGGGTIADVAEANDVDPDAVVDAMVDAAEERLDGKVEAGRLTAEEADERLAEKADRIEDKVNGVDDEGDEL